MDFGCDVRAGSELPTWVPNGVKLYLRHTGGGESLRTLARETGCHASTVMRQVRRFENQRDDPLIDEALDVLTSAITPERDAAPSSACEKGNYRMNVQLRPAPLPDEDTLNREARRILRRLSETGAMLVLAVDMDKAVVLREGPDGPPTRTAIVPRDVAQAFAVKDWISCKKAGRIATYHITQAGRAALKRLLAEDAAKRNKSGSRGSVHSEQHREWDERSVMIGGDDDPRPVRVNAAESPLTMLARRKDSSGRPFLDQELVQAGERFREDFEMAQMGPRVAQNWDRFLTSGDRGGFDSGGGLGDGPRAARDRVLAAMTDLGPGLGDIIMRCCCYLEGLEAAEKRMGWSARSGKIVLRIALQRLRRHYVEKHGSVTAMLG